MKKLKKINHIKIDDNNNNKNKGKKNIMMRLKYSEFKYE